MKIKIVTQLAAVTLFLASLGAAEAQAPAPVVPRPSEAMGALPAGSNVNPDTGLPVQTPWISSDWTDPTDGKPPVPIVIPDVDFDGFPLAEVAHRLHEQFHGQFDILVAPSWTAPSGEVFNLDQWTVKIQLHNVTASQIFRAMNLSFEAQGFPLRWQLMLNDSRPTVLLRVLPEIMERTTHPLNLVTGLPNGGTPPPEKPRPMVIYVGDLLGDEKSGGMGLQQIVDTLLKVNKMAGNADLDINASEEAQLIVIKGTGDQIVFTESTLQALKQKVAAARVAKVLTNAAVETPTMEAK